MVKWLWLLLKVAASQASGLGLGEGNSPFKGGRAPFQLRQSGETSWHWLLSWAFIGRKGLPRLKWRWACHMKVNMWTKALRVNHRISEGKPLVSCSFAPIIKSMTPPPQGLSKQPQLPTLILDRRCTWQGLGPMSKSSRHRTAQETSVGICSQQDW